MSLRARIEQVSQDLRQNLSLTHLVLYDTKASHITLDRFTLQDVFNAVAEDPRAPIKNLSKRHKIPVPVLEAGQAYMIAKLPELYEKAAGPPGTKRSFLIDENLPPGLSAKLWHDFGAATHPNFIGMGKAKDPEIWNWAVKNKMDAIITRDIRLVEEAKDLSLLALRHAYDHLKNNHQDGKPYKLNGQPIVIGFDSKSDKTVWPKMRRNQNDIHKLLHLGHTPLARITEHGVIPVITTRAVGRAQKWDNVLTMVQK
ncbi:MAG: DUF5615 family PIN-like protein [Rhodospirillales bacterium]|nr:DUF5615 family PIN-like protein [Rhodospirillales bacterium]MCB9995228.1 DUF5615 family PIN-like protein [Rhodospirillales bacterium]